MDTLPKYPVYRSDLVWNLCRSSCRAATVVLTLSALCWTKLHFMQNKEVKSSTRTAPWFFWLLMLTIILDISWYFWMIDVEACQCNVCILQHSYNHRYHSYIPCSDSAARPQWRAMVSSSPWTMLRNMLLGAAADIWLWYNLLLAIFICDNIW